jgi:hypothetical protein
MATTERITLSDDNEIAQAMDRLLRYCREEYDYYDGLPRGDPNHIEPSDVLATLSVNSFITNAAQMRRIHQGMVANCDGLLSAIPSDIDLVNCSPKIFEAVERLLHEAIQVHGVLIPVATKILHRKRPSLIPMLDNIVLNFYLNVNERNDLVRLTQDKRRAAGVAMIVLDFFLKHLRSILPQIELVQRQVVQEGYVFTPVRILELLVWITAEERGYYRNY